MAHRLLYRSACAYRSVGVTPRWLLPREESCGEFGESLRNADVPIPLALALRNDGVEDQKPSGDWRVGQSSTGQEGG